MVRPAPRNHSAGLKSLSAFPARNGTRGGVYHAWQLSDRKGWQPSWQRYLPPPDESNKDANVLVSARDGVGRVMVAWISGGAICFAQAVHADASLLSSFDLRIREVIDPFDHKSYGFKYLTIGKYPNGRIEVLALSTNGRVWSIRQRNLVDDGNPWIGQTRTNGRLDSVAKLVGGGDLKNISVTRLGSGLALAGTGNDGRVYVKTQTVPEAWDNDPWTNLGGSKVSDVRAAESKEHQFEVVALGGDNRLYLQYQNVGSKAFSGWQLLSNGTSDTKYGRAFFVD